MSLTIPASAFATPTAAEYAQNQAYWNAYLQGELLIPAILPSAAGVADYATYCASVQPLMQAPITTTIGGIIGINTGAVGYNAALWDAANWEWDNDPNSGHNKVIG